MTLWNKYTYVCPDCDTLVEATSHKRQYRDECLTCPSTLVLLSVEDATIYPTKQKEEQTMETPITATITDMYDPTLLVTYKKIENGETSFATDKVSDIEYALDQSRRNYKNLTEKQNAWYKKESQLRTLLEEVYAESDEQDVLAQIAEIFDIPLTKEIEYTAWVRVDMTIEVDMTGDLDNIEELISQNLTVDSYGSEISVNNYEIDRVEEGAY
jgi:hypothetical protein